MDESQVAAYWLGMSTSSTVLNFLPFGLLLAMIAILPLNHRTEPWWGKNSNKMMVASACCVAGVLLAWLPTGHSEKVLHTFLEYFTFMALIGSLYVVCGGIHISGAFSGLPYFNTLFLAMGALLANLMGTTGASMILIRPFIRANQMRQYKSHLVIFFIFIVSNAGGSLTPLGDPPLYLGFLRGVPFEWTFRLLPQWGLLMACLLVIFHFVDEYLFHREEKETKHLLVEEIMKAKKAIHIDGKKNVFFLLCLLAAIMASGYLVYPRLAAMYGAEKAGIGSQVFQIMAFTLIALMSYDLTMPKMYDPSDKKTIYGRNEFTLAPLTEVAILFLGIFGAMIPTMSLMEAKGHLLGLEKPWHFFWTSGILSSFLDNAPTYLTYATLAAGKMGLSTEHFGELAEKFPRLLEAVACGSVFMGANTYIGNGPNFMVKTIAEHAKVKMPSFLGYMAWSGCVLIPLFILETFVFFR